MRNRPTNLRFLCALAACLAACWLGRASIATAQPSHPAQPVAADAAQIARWIDELGHDSYTVRQAASENLLSAGPLARDALQLVADSPDPEIRAAAQRLLSLVEASDFRLRLNAFAADADGKLGVTLPGWDAFQKLVGSDARDRALFVEMQRQEPQLLATAFQPRMPGFTAAWENRLTRLVNEQRGGRNTAAPLASSVAMIFLATVPTLEVSDQVTVLVTQLMHRPQVYEAMRTGVNRDSLRRLISAWVMHCPNKSESSLQQRLNVARVNQLGETLPLAFAIAARGDDFRNLSIMTRMMAVLHIGQLGGPEHVNQLEPLLEDRTVCIPGETIAARRDGPGGGVDVQLRDVALMALLHMTGQAPDEYGYPHGQRPAGQDWNVGLMYPRSAEQRELAIAKWRNWKANKSGPFRESQRTRAAAAAAAKSAAEKER